MARNKKKMSERTFINTVHNLVKRHGRVRIISQDADFEDPCDCMCKNCLNRFEESAGKPDQRRRLIDKTGDCKVSYKGSDYNKWSSFSRSCFLGSYDDDYDCRKRCYEKYDYCRCEPKKNVKQTVKYMLEHDSYDINLKPVMIEYGFRFKRKMKVKL